MDPRYRVGVKALSHLWILAVAALDLVAAGSLPLPADGKFVAPAERCIRLTATQPTTVRVNGLAVGQIEKSGGEVDITGYLRIGKSNDIQVDIPSATLLVSPLVYLRSATSDGKTMTVAVVNTTENTVQVELGESHQFTVSPGTTAYKEFPATGSKRLRMRATSDGLDHVYEDEIQVVVTTAKQSPA